MPSRNVWFHLYKLLPFEKDLSPEAYLALASKVLSLKEHLCAGSDAPLILHGFPEAARALGVLGHTGTLEVGKDADLAIWSVERPAELVYRIGFNPRHKGPGE